MKSIPWYLLVAAALYLGIVFVPPYVESYQVKQVLREAANKAIRDSDPDRLKAFIIAKCRTIGSRTEFREGHKVVEPGVVLLFEDISVNRDAQEKTIIIQADYEVVVDFPFTDRQTVLSFSPVVEGDLHPVVW